MRLNKNLMISLATFSIGVMIGDLVLRTPPASASPELVVELHRFQHKPDQLEEFDRWVAFEHGHHAETIATLEREHMYAETIFRDREHDPTTIFWAELRGAGGSSVTTSPRPIDKIYKGFMHRTLVAGSRVTLKPEYTLVPPFLLESIAAHELPAQGKR